MCRFGHGEQPDSSPLILQAGSPTFSFSALKHTNEHDKDEGGIGSGNAGWADGLPTDGA